MHTEREPVDADALSEMGYEKRDVNFGALTKWIAAFFALGFLFFAVAYGFFYFLAPKQIQAGNATTPPVTKRVPPAPNPLLQNNVETKVDIQVLRQSEIELLTSYGWVSQEQGVVRLPIQRAKELIAQRGAQPTGRNVAPIARPDVSPRDVTGQTAADKAPGGANAGDTSPRTSIPTRVPTQDPNRNGGVTNAPTGSDAPPSNASQGDVSAPGAPAAPGAMRPGRE